MLDDVQNPCSAACDLPWEERRHRARQVCARSPRVCSFDQPPHPRSGGHERTRKRPRPQQHDTSGTPGPVEAPRPAKHFATNAPAEGGSTESAQILSALKALTESVNRLASHQGPLSSPSLPPGQDGEPPSTPESSDEEHGLADVDVLSLHASPNPLQDVLGAELQSDAAVPADDSTAAGEVPVSSLMSRVLSAANILGLQSPTSGPTSLGGVWEGVSRPNPPHSIPLAADYVAMLRSTWGKPLQRPQFNAGCRQVALASYAAETGLGDMPPVEASIASWTSLGPAHLSSNPRCPGKECAKTDRLATRTFNAAARAARMGNAMAISLAALRRTLPPDDQDAKALLDAALTSHSQLTRDVGDAMASSVLCRRQVWLAQTKLTEAIRTELLSLPVTPGHVFHPDSQGVLDRAEQAAASRAAVQHACHRSASGCRRATPGRYRQRHPAQPQVSSVAPASRRQPFRAPARQPPASAQPRGRRGPRHGPGRGAGHGGGHA